MNAPQPVDTRTLTAHLDALTAAAPRWAALPPGRIVPMLEEVKHRTLAAASRWVQLSCEAKGLEPGSPLRGEEWVSGPWALLAGINGMIHTLTALAVGSDPLAGFKVHTRPDGIAVVDVFPAHHWDALLLNGYSAEVWQQRDVPATELRRHVAGRFSREVQPRVGLVLGAGNINSIPPLDALWKLVGDGEVCLVKLNPINDYLLEPLTEAFRPFVDAGYLRFVKGDGATGAWLCDHPAVGSLHITGSGHTHDLIVFGGGPEGAERKARGEPLNPRPITSELGGVGPTIVVPGPWNTRDIRFQAEHLVTQKLHNRGFNCIASQVLVVSKHWPHKDALLAAVKQVLREVVDDRPDYYRGIESRRGAFLEAHPDAERFGGAGAFALVEGLQPGSGDHCFTEESFGPMWAVVEIDELDPSRFLRAAVQFANEELMGTLGAQLVVHPDTERDHAGALDLALADLRYGSIGVNVWSGAGFLLPNAAWGAYPGHTLSDVQSGIGVVHNALLFDKPLKTVVRGPFRPFPRTVLSGQLHISPKPLWFVTHKGAERAGELLTRFEVTRDVSLIPPLFLAALSG